MTGGVAIPSIQRRDQRCREGEVRAGELDVDGTKSFRQFPLALVEAEQSLSELDRVPGDLRDLVDNHMRYYDLQHQAFTLEVEAMRSNDEVLLAEAENLHAEAIAALE